MYLCYCEAGFTERRIGVAQLLYVKPGRRPGQRQRGSITAGSPP